MTADRKLLVTGAAGRLGTLLRGPLAEAGYSLRLSDRRGVKPRHPGERFVRARLESPRAMRRVCAGMDAVLHLGGVPAEQDWDTLIAANVTGVARLLEAARASGVRRFVFASSMHVLGMYARDQPIEEGIPVAPDTRYGVTKAFGEAACRLFADKYGMAITVVRIGHVVPDIAQADPGQGVGADDLVRLLLTVLSSNRPGFDLVHALAPYPGDHVSDGRLARDHGFAFAHPGAGEARLPDAGLSFGPRGLRVRGGAFADEP